jgi:hypothetical protein
MDNTKNLRSILAVSVGLSIAMMTFTASAERGGNLDQGSGAALRKRIDKSSPLVKQDSPANIAPQSASDPPMAPQPPSQFSWGATQSSGTQAINSPRDAASGQATGQYKEGGANTTTHIISPRDPQSGLPTGK